MTGEINQHKIILVPASDEAVTDAYRSDPAWKDCGWLYLSPDALLRRRLDKTALPALRFIDIGDRLQEAARELRQDYIDFIGGLSRQYHSRAWWLTSVSEKNPFISRVFLYLCYLRVLEAEYGKHDTLVVVCDADSLMDAIQDSFASREGLAITVYAKKSTTITRIGVRLRGMEQKSVFAIRFLLRVLLAKLFMVLRHGKESSFAPAEVFIHSWTDTRSFERSGTYTEVYFGKLAEKVQAECPNTIVLCNVLPTMFYPKALAALLQCSDRVHLFENYLAFSDIIRALVFVNRKLPEISHVPALKQLDLTAIIRDEVKSDRTGSSRSELSCLHYFAGKRIAQNSHARVVLATFENHMWEKMFIYGIRESCHGCKFIGYAHSIVSQWYLFYSLAASERAIAPVPDRILVNGAVAAERLADSGFDRDTIRVCGAFRYAAQGGNAIPRRTQRENQKVLVVPTSGINETIELVDKSVLALKDLQKIIVKIKLHPNMPMEKVIPLYQDLPSNFSFTEEPVGKLLTATDLVLFTESTVAVEALKSHIPILHIRSGLRIDMNIFEGIVHVPSASSAAEISLKSREMLVGKSFPDEQYDSIVESFFTPVDDTVIWECIGTLSSGTKR